MNGIGSAVPKAHIVAVLLKARVLKARIAVTQFPVIVEMIVLVILESRRSLLGLPQLEDRSASKATQLLYLQQLPRKFVALVVDVKSDIPPSQIGETLEHLLLLLVYLVLQEMVVWQKCLKRFETSNVMNLSGVSTVIAHPIQPMDDLECALTIREIHVKFLSGCTMNMNRCTLVTCMLQSQMLSTP